MYTLTKGRFNYAQLISLIFLIDSFAFGTMTPLILSVGFLVLSLFVKVDEDSGVLKKSMLTINESLLTVVPVISLYAYMVYHESNAIARLVLVLMAYSILYSISHAFQHAYAELDESEDEKDIDNDK